MKVTAACDRKPISDGANALQFATAAFYVADVYGERSRPVGDDWIPLPRMPLSWSATS